MTARAMKALLTAAALSVVVLGQIAMALSSHAALVTWTLDDVRLTRIGGNQPIYSATGSFLYDASNQSIPDWSITLHHIDTGEPFSSFEPVDPSNCQRAPAPCGLADRAPGPVPASDTLNFRHDGGTPVSMRHLTLIAPQLTDAGGIKPLLLDFGAGFGQGGITPFDPATITAGRLIGEIPRALTNTIPRDRPRHRCDSRSSARRTANSKRIGTSNTVFSSSCSP